MSLATEQVLQDCLKGLKLVSCPYQKKNLVWVDSFGHLVSCDCLL